MLDHMQLGSEKNKITWKVTKSFNKLSWQSTSELLRSCPRVHCSHHPALNTACKKGYAVSFVAKAFHTLSAQYSKMVK